MACNNYVLLTSARNEERYIKYSIDSILAQTLLPKKWIIISDGSKDGTDDIVLACSKAHSFIEFIRRDHDTKRADFASKVFAIGEGYKRLKGVDYNYLGILDADISFGVDYYSKILSRFHENRKLGIAGGFIQ